MRRPSLGKPSLPKPSLSKLRRRQPTSAARGGSPAPAGPALSRKLPPRRVIVGAVVAILALFLLVRACGSDDEQEVRETVERFAEASREKDYQALCDDLISTAIVENLRSTGQPCEVALRIGLGEVENPTVEVTDVSVDGDRAEAEVNSEAAGQRPSTDTIELIKEDDGWRIASLENEAPADPLP